MKSEKANIDISIPLPDEYVGKQLHVLIYADEEILNRQSIPKPHTKKPSDFFGTLSESESDKLHEYVSKSRQEWERDF